jgi:hypothetical protein
MNPNVIKVILPGGLVIVAAGGPAVWITAAAAAVILLLGYGVYKSLSYGLKQKQGNVTGAKDRDGMPLAGRHASDIRRQH